MRTSNGYLATWIGSLAGVLMLGALLGGVVYALTRDCDPRGFDCLGSAIVVLFAGVGGALIGAVLGAHGALRLRRHRAAGLTAWVLAVLLTATVGTVSVIANASGDGGFLAMPAMGVMLVLPLAARRIALGIARARGHRRVPPPSPDDFGYAD